jgi:hypothetical protein
MKIHVGIVVLATAGIAAASRGDDLTGKDRLLCTAVEANLCTPGGECLNELPWNLNNPQFLEVNLKDKVVSTTKASGENRSSPIRTLQREGGLILFQGTEGGRAFSFVIEEKTGIASVAVARESLTVSIFGACTPMPEGK